MWVMNTRVKVSLFMHSLAILTLTLTLLASVPSIAAQTSNMTEGSQPLTNDTLSSVGQIPEVALQSVLEQTQGANATSFAIGNIINQTGLSNATQQGSSNTTLNSVIEEARNTNATSFAAGNIINQTQSGNNITAN